MISGRVAGVGVGLTITARFGAEAIVPEPGACCAHSRPHRGRRITPTRPWGQRCGRLLLDRVRSPRPDGRSRTQGRRARPPRRRGGGPARPGVRSATPRPRRRPCARSPHSRSDSLAPVSIARLTTRATASLRTRTRHCTLISSSRGVGLVRALCSAALVKARPRSPRSAASSVPPAVPFAPAARSERGVGGMGSSIGGWQV
jgi:hypothetical protein